MSIPAVLAGRTSEAVSSSRPTFASSSSSSPVMYRRDPDARRLLLIPAADGIHRIHLRRSTQNVPLGQLQRHRDVLRRHTVGQQQPDAGVGDGHACPASRRRPRPPAPRSAPSRAGRCSSVKRANASSSRVRTSLYLSGLVWLCMVTQMRRTPFCSARQT